MKAGEGGVIAAAAVFIAGGIFVGVTPLSVEEPSPQEEDAGDEWSVYEELKTSIQPYHFGNLPRESFRADTTVWVVDLDYNMYTVPQVDLFVTRELRDLGMTAITARERSGGGVVFNAVFPNGLPLEIQFTCP